jgi:hypothetical protein
MQSVRKGLICVALLATMVGFAGSVAAQASKENTSPTAVKARKEWRKTMHHTPAPREGCFHASYPSTQWQTVQCAPAPGYRSARPRGFNPEQVGGTGSGSTDLVTQAPSGYLFSNVEGTFLSVRGVTSETGVGVAVYRNEGILGANEYSLQVNTNASHSAACGSYSYCNAWQQYVMSTNTPVSLTSGSLTNETEVFIEYWLLNYGVDNGTNICPSGFDDSGPDNVGPGDDCVQNTPATEIYNGQLPITDLADLSLSGSATANGTDEATVTYGGEAYKATVPDSYTDIASVWNQAEFNVVGNSGGSEAEFNSGASIIVQVAVTDGSANAPSCALNSGTTGESNNLNLVPSNNSPVCCPFGGASPGIVFMESNATIAAPACSYLEHPYAWLSALSEILLQ